MKKILAPLAAAGLLLTSVATAAPALADQPGTSSADIVGTVKLIDSTTAEVQARYSCTGTAEQLHLWVSVKQSANGTANPALAVPDSGYGGKATAWSQGHGAAATLRCDGKTHVDRFLVDRTEFGYGDLQKGRAYVQFCLFDATAQVEPISSMGFVNIH